MVGRSPAFAAGLNPNLKASRRLGAEPHPASLKQSLNDPFRGIAYGARLPRGRFVSVG